MLNIAYYIELTWLIIDTLSGFLQNTGITLPGNQTLGSLFRIFILVFFTLIVIKYQKGGSKASIALVLSAFAVTLIHALFYGFNEIQVIVDFQFQLKILMAILAYRVFEIQFIYGGLTIIRIKKIVIVNAIVMLLNLYLGIMGIGFDNYGMSDTGEMLGSTGFFYSGNEVSVTLVAIYALVVFLFRDSFVRHAFRLALVIFMFFIASISLFGKTAMLGFVLVTLFAVYNYLSFLNKIRFFGLFALFLAVTYAFWLPLVELAFGRWYFFYVHNPDFLSFITSGRTDRVSALYRGIFETPLFVIIFGQGWLGSDAIITFENDILDLFTSSGIVGVAVYSIWFAWMMSGASTFLKNRSEEGVFACCFVMLLLLVSVIAGHVIYSVMLAPFIAFIAITSSRYYPKVVRSKQLT